LSVRHAFVLVIATAACAGCDSGGGELPPGATSEDLRTFHVDVTKRGKPIRAFGGLDGNPLPGKADAATETDLTALYQSHGVRQVRLSRGSGCDVALDAVFPAPNLAAGEPGAPDYATLDEVLKNALASGMPPIWGAMYDVGKGACSRRGDLEEGSGIADPDVWATAVVQTLQHMRSSGLVAPIVEFYPDPFGAGGYSKGQAFQHVNAWARLREALRAAFPAASGSPGFQIAAPGIPIEAAGAFTDADHAFATFGNHLATTPADAPDALSFASVAWMPEDHLAIAEEARLAAVRWGLAALPLADGGARPPEALWTELAGLLTTPARRSAFLAAHLAAARVLLQDRVESFAAARWAGPPDAGGTPEDLFVRPDRTSLPALESMIAFYLMESAAAVRVPAALADGKASDGKGVAALAAVGKDGTLFLLAALADPGRIGAWVRVRFDVTGLPANAASAKVLRVTVDESTEAFAWQEDSRAPVTGGELTIERTAWVPAVMLLQVTPIEAVNAPAAPR